MYIDKAYMKYPMLLILQDTLQRKQSLSQYKINTKSTTAGLKINPKRKDKRSWEFKFKITIIDLIEIN